MFCFIFLKVSSPTSTTSTSPSTPAPHPASPSTSGPSTGAEGGPDLPTEGAAWVMPLAAGSYRVGCSITCYPGHTGQDFPAADGTNLVSATAGTVTRSEALRDDNGNYRSYGNLIVIRPAGQPGMEIFYAHLSARDVQAGQTVTPGNTSAAPATPATPKAPTCTSRSASAAAPATPCPSSASKECNHDDRRSAPVPAAGSSSASSPGRHAP